MSRPARLWTDILTTTATKFAVVPLSMATSIVVTRSLGPSQKGQYSTVFTALNLLAMVGAFGVSRAALYHLTTDESDLDPGSVRSTSLGFSALAAMLLSMLFLGAAQVDFLGFLPPAPTMMYLAAAPLIVAGALRAVFETELRAAQRTRSVNVVQVVASIALLVVTLALAGSGRLTGTTAIAARTVSITLAAAAAVSAIRSLNVSYGWEIRRGTLDRLLAYGLAYSAINIALNLSYDVDVLILAHYRPADDVGQYATAVSVAELLWYLPMAAGMVLVPIAAKGARDQAARTTTRTLTITVALSAVAACGLFALAPTVVELMFGAEFLPAVSPLRWLLPGVVAVTVYQVTSAYLLSRNHLRSLMIGAVAGAVVNVVLNIALVPSLGGKGAALASDVSYALTGGLSLLTFRTHSRAAPQPVTLAVSTAVPAGSGVA